MKTVGITQRSLPPTEFGELRYALDARWFDFLSACDLIGVALPNSPDVAVRTALALDLDGLILSGGESLTDYGGRSPLRDTTERALLDWAIDRRRPVLGVCRGMQLILHVFGAELVTVDGHVATRHDVAVNGGVRNVNSYHRYTARAVPPSLVVTASCNGVVEGIRHQHADIAGIMWHLERETNPVAEDVHLVTTLFQSAS